MRNGLLPFMMTVLVWVLDAMTAADSFVAMPPVLRGLVESVVPALISSVMAVTSGMILAPGCFGSWS